MFCPMAYELPHEREGNRPLAAPRVVERPHVAPVRAPHESAARGEHRAREPLPQEIVPPEDLAALPLLVRAGMKRLSRRVFGEQLEHNIVSVCFGARLERGFATVLWCTVLPLLLTPLSAVLVLDMGRPTRDLLALLLLLVFPLLYGLVAVAWTGRHVRRMLEALPLEELLLTRLRPIELVQGMIAVPAAGLMMPMRLQVLISYGMLIAGGVVHDHGDRPAALLPSLAAWVIAGGLSLLATTAAIELAAASSGRAHLFFARPLLAGTRAALELLSRLLLGMLAVGGVIGALALLGSMVALLAMAGAVVVAVRMLMHEGIGNPSEDAADAVAFAARWHLEWWPYQEDGSAEGEAMRRGLFTPWISLETRRRFVIRQMVRG